MLGVAADGDDLRAGSPQGRGNGPARGAGRAGHQDAQPGGDA
jgi:hypothetical protein